MNIYGTLTRLYLQLFKNGISTGQTKIFTPFQIKKILTDKFGTSISITFNDLSFTCASENFLKQLHDNCWWNNPSFQYVSDMGDCENYAEFFNGLVALQWKINTMGIVFGDMKINGQWIPHAFCLPILLNENGEPEIWMYDPLCNICVAIEDINKIEDLGYQWKVGHVEYH